MSDLSPASAPVNERPVPVRALVAVLAVAVVAAGLFVWVNLGTAELPGLVRTPALDVVGLEFVDYASSEDGTVVDLVPPAGELTVAYFGYLSCPDVCPTTLADLRVGLQQLDEGEASRITVAFVTVDEDRDTGAEITEYLSRFYPDLPNGIAALRADAGTELQDAADRLQVYFEIADHELGQERYDVGHSAVTFIIDETGTVVRELPFGASPDDFAAVMAASLKG